MQLTLPFPNSISNVNPSSMRWKSALENVRYIVENWINARIQTTLSLKCALCSKLMFNTHSRLSPECPACPGQEVWRGQAVTRADHQPRPRSSCSAASWRSWPAPPHSSWRLRASQRSGQSKSAHLRKHETRFDFYNSKASSYKCVAPNQHKKCHASKVKSESGSTS